MTVSVVPSSLPQINTQTRWIDRVAKRLVTRQLERITEGQILIIDGEGPQSFGSDTADLFCAVHMADFSVWSDLAFGGSVAAGESYMEGRWFCDDLVTLTRIFSRERDVLIDMDSGTVSVTQLVRRIGLAFHRNTRRGSKKNIQAHYDLSNDFFELFLDKAMQYSSGIFAGSDAELDEAQIIKMDVIADRLDLEPGMHVLEIGTGWGGLAVHLATHHDVKVTTTTISQAQYEAACERVTAAGLEERVTVLCRDYRDLEGTYDRIVSVEMIEAVGHEYYETFFEACGDRLKKNGLLVMQAICLPDADYNRARREVDFIKKHIFPGCCIPSLPRLAQAASRSGRLEWTQYEDYSADYAATLRHWRQRCDAASSSISDLGFDDQFQRMWRFYLAYCEGGFAERVITLGHIVFAAPHYRDQSHVEHGYAVEATYS